MPSPAATLAEQITPTEAVLLFSDRLVDSHPKPRMDEYTVPTSGAGVFGLDVVEVAVETLVASMLASGVEPTVEERRAWIVLKSSRLHLRCTGPGRDWPSGSPEARLLAWLEAQPGQVGGLTEALIELFMPTPMQNVWGLAYSALHAGLVERGYLECTRRSMLGITLRDHFSLPPSQRAEILHAAPELAGSHLGARDRLDPAVREAAGRSWRAAYVAQDIDVGV
ncbi:MAG: hypothetical protein R3B35_00600 [Gemmatimonadales bacterium]